jgi:hypothetical protein
MKQSKFNRNLFGITFIALLLTLGIPATSLAQDHQEGQRRNRDNPEWSRRDRKCGKFVNCHDARNGRWDRRQSRWDRREARGDRVGNIVLRNRFPDRVRNRNNNYWLTHRRYARRFRN